MPFQVGRPLVAQAVSRDGVLVLRPEAVCQPTGFDGALPQGGLAVWHVDETKGSIGSNNPNTDEGYAGQSGWPGNGRHYRAALLQADGGYDMEHGFDRGDGGDVYHAGGVATIDGSTTPGTDAYQGGNIVANGNRILSIGSAGASMGFQYQSPQAPTITTSSLPNGSIGVAYSQGLSATGGNSPLWWSEFVESPSYWEQDLGSSLYSSVGSAQGWNADEGLWQLSLPFDFPFYETVYDTVWVSSNGFLDFAPGDTEPFNDSLYLRSLHRIAPLWDDLRTDAGAGQDIYVATGTPGQVTIRWVGEHYDTGSNVRFAVTLFEDGRVRFDYGSGNSSISPTVGISRGEGAQQILVAGYDGMGGLGNADSILFTLQGSQLPPGLSLSSAGVLSGTPTTNGSWSPWFRVTDDDRRYDMVQLSVSVGADCNNNGVDDATDIANGTSQDCNANGVPDECELAGNDCNANLVPDECDVDCNSNGTPDDCESITDCNSNGVPDECDIAGGGSLDADVDGVPDECQTVGAYMCFGDGSSGACPCGNSAAPGEGCRNSTGVGGRLAASGSALVSNDDLVLHASQCRPNRNGVFLQGTTAIAAPFKDGILCMGNPTERLEFITLDAAGNGSSTASIVTEGLVTPGVTRYYQFWFRDGGGQSVCGQNSNLTSGLRVDWL